MSILSCASLTDLFPPGARAAVLEEPGDETQLLPAEAACVARAVEARRREFAAGRQCAHRILQELGAAPAPILMAVDRQPLWPAGFVGSITHTQGFCAAVAAPLSRVRALGLDAERADAVREELWRMICVSEEIERMERAPSALRTRLAASTFCAKEAFHKCQYPLSGEWLGFEDVAVEIEVLGAHRSEFTILPRRPLLFAERIALPWRGALLHENGLVCGGIGFAADAA